MPIQPTFPRGLHPFFRESLKLDCSTSKSDSPREGLGRQARHTGPCVRTDASSRPLSEHGSLVDLRRTAFAWRSSAAAHDARCWRPSRTGAPQMSFHPGGAPSPRRVAPRGETRFLEPFAQGRAPPGRPAGAHNAVPKPAPTPGPDQPHRRPVGCTRAATGSRLSVAPTTQSAPRGPLLPGGGSTPASTWLILPVAYACLKD